MYKRQEVVYNAVGQKIIFDSGRPIALECLYQDTNNNNQKIETVAADQFVICGGAWSSSLADSLGIRLPLVSGKGYSMTLTEPVQLPSICSILNEARVAVTPFNGSLRFAGTMELGDNDLSVNSRRINGILKSIPRYFPKFQPQHFNGVKQWSGLRPCSPDGLPYLGPAGPDRENIFVATGHAMMGLSLAPVTGKIMADLLCGEKNEINLKAMSPLRFN